MKDYSKELPIEINAAIKTECWTFYKMSIIQKIVDYQSWVAINLPFFVEGNCHTSFGRNGEVHFPSEFSAILDVAEVPCSLVCDDRILSELISNIDSGRYMIIYINYNSLFRDDYSPHRYHEILIYGYKYIDEKLYFYSVLFIKDGFKECLIEGKLICQGYSHARVSLKGVIKVMAG